MRHARVFGVWALMASSVAISPRRSELGRPAVLEAAVRADGGAQRTPRLLALPVHPAHAVPPRRHARKRAAHGRFPARGHRADLHDRGSLLRPPRHSPRR